MQQRRGSSLKVTVLIAQVVLIGVYAAFFSMVPAVLDNPENHRGNILFFVPGVALLISIMGFFRPRVSAVLMMVYSLVVYASLVILDRGQLSSFAYALGPVWLPIVAAGALLWVAKQQPTLGKLRGE